MRFLRFFLFIFLFALFTFPCHSVFAAGTLTPSRVQRQTLPNGMKLILLEDHSLPLVAIDLWIKAGSAEDPPEARGVGHLLEHMLFKGTTKLDLGGVDTAMENLGASLSAVTQKDATHLSVTVASRFAPQALEILSEMILNASVPEAELPREKGVILDEMILAYSDPMRRVADELTARAYGDHPYGRSIPGDREQLLKIPRASVIDAQKRRLVGSNLALVLVGDFQPSKMVNQVKEVFEAVQKGTFQRASLEPVKWTESKTQEISIPGDRSYVYFGFPGPSAAQKKEVAALDLIYGILQLGAESRLGRALVDKDLAERVQVDFLTQRGPGLFIIGAQCRADRVERVKEVIEEELAKLRDDLLTDEDLKSARIRILSGLAFDTETYGGMASTLGFYEAVGQPDLAVQYPDLIRSVTAEDLRQVAKFFLLPSRAIRLTAHPKPPGEKPLEPGKPEIVPLPDTEPVGANSGHESLFRLSSYAPAAAPQKRTTVTVMELPQKKNATVEDKPVIVTHPQARKILLPSGLTVIVKPIPGQQILSTRLFVKAGAMQETDVPAGTAALLARLLVTESAHPSIKDQLAFLHDQVGGGLNAEPGEDTTGFSVLTTKEHLDEALNLLAFIATRPPLRESELEAERQMILRSEQNELDPFNTAIEAFLRRVYPENRLGLPLMGTSDSRKEIKAATLEQFWKAYYALGNMVVVVAGDVNPNGLAGRVDDIFRKKVSPGRTDEIPFATPQTGPVLRNELLERPQPVGAVVVGVRSPGALDESYPALAVLSAILGGGKGSRLFHVLRDTEGIGYDLGTWSPPRARYGYLAGYVLADPFRSAPDGSQEPILVRARKLMLDEMKSVAEGNVTEAELARARQFVIGSYALRHQRVADQSYLLGWWEAMGAGMEKDEAFPVHIEKVTLEEVKKLAQSLLVNFSSIVILPEASS